MLINLLKGMVPCFEIEEVCQSQSDSCNVDPKQINRCNSGKDKTFRRQSDSFNADPKQLISCSKTLTFRK